MKYNYDVAVIGGGAAGLTSSGMAASFGAKTIMIEEKKLGGDCTWYGCVPSKALLKAAKVANTINTANRYGIQAELKTVDLQKVLSIVHHIQDEVYKDADDPKIYEDMGVEVAEGKAKFINKNEIEIVSDDGSTRKISAKYFVIATGSSPVIPPIPGLNSIPFLTNENVFLQEKLPPTLVVVGAGPIGIEIGQAFSRLGSEVTIVDLADRILTKDDPELTTILMKKMESEGIKFMLGYSVNEFQKLTNSLGVLLKNESSGDITTIETEAVLLSVGRQPNIAGLNLESANVVFDKSGIQINSKCQTSSKNIYACGDVAGTYQFTHYAEHMAKTAISNMILKLPFKLDKANVPWVTYTDPEIAHTGMNESQLKQKGIKYEVYRFPFSKVDRAITDGEKDGWIKVYASARSGKIFGADIVGHNAGEMITEFLLAIKNGVSLRKMADTIHPYPTYGLGNRRTADQWYVRKQSRVFVKVLQTLFGLRGQLPDTSDPNRII